MKKMAKVISYFLTCSMLAVTLCGCNPDETVDPEEVRQYAEMLDPATLRAYAAMFEEVADELEAEALEEEVEEIDTEEELEDTEEVEEESEEDEDSKEAEDSDVKDSDKKSDKSDKEDTKKTAKEEADNEEIVDINTLIKEQYSNDSELEYKDGNETATMEISYHIPTINDDSSDAKKINKEIEKLFDEAIDDIKTKADPLYSTINYDVYQNDEIASIVVYGIDTYGDVLDTQVFSYNTKTHERVTAEEVFDKLEMTEDEIEGYLAKTLGAYVLSDVEKYLDVIDNYYGIDKEMYTGIIGAIANTFQVVMSETDVLKDMTVYLDNEGEPHVVGNITLPEGYGSYVFDTPLETAEKPAIYEKYSKYVEKYHYPEFEMEAFILDNGGMYEFEVPKEYRTDEFDYDTVKIGFSDDENAAFACTLVKDKKEEAYTGSVSFAGVSEKGFEFMFSLDNLDGKKVKNNIKKGTFSVVIDFDYDDEGYMIYQGARITSIDGFDFTGAAGKAVEFVYKEK